MLLKANLNEGTGGGSEQHEPQAWVMFKIVHAYRAGVVTDTAKDELEISN